MLCKIADLITDIPELGGLAPRVREYLWETDSRPDVIIRESDLRKGVWKGLPYETYCYMESGSFFYMNLLYHGGMMLHASAIAYEGRAYLFSGPSGVGKSTHTRLWKETFGDKVVVFNDDKPALRFLDGQWFAYGTPWCGKDGINTNMKVPLAGICFLEQGETNTISLLAPMEAIPYIIPQTLHKFKTPERAELMLKNIGTLIDHVPMFHMVDRPDREAVMLAHDTMSRYVQKQGI